MNDKHYRVLVDANVACTYVSGREDLFAEPVNQIMKLCASGKIDGFLAFHFQKASSEVAPAEKK